MTETDKLREEVTPEDLHNWYLEATKKLNPESYNEKAQKPYTKLTREQQLIDVFMANKINLAIKKAREDLLDDLKIECNKMFVEIKLPLGVTGRFIRYERLEDIITKLRSTVAKEGK